MELERKKKNLLIVLAGFFITNAVVAELISSKIFSTPEFLFLGLHVPSFTTIVGIIPWPVVFLSTDIINEFYGQKTVRKLSYLTMALIFYAFIIVYLAMQLKAVPFSPANDETFALVFGQSQKVILASIIAFLISQLLDVAIFANIKRLTKEKYIWLRATGSTLISQLIDSFIVLYIGFYIGSDMTMNKFWEIGFTNYSFKIIIAFALIPLVYVSHYFIKKYLGTSHDKA
jgi:queuosine precursor transporter